MTNSTSQKIVGSTYTKNNITYLVVDNDTIREESNLLRFLNGDIRFDTSLVTDLSEVFAFRNLINCKNSFLDFDITNVDNFKLALNGANHIVTAYLKFTSKFLFKSRSEQPYLSGYHSYFKPPKQKNTTPQKIEVNEKLIVGDTFVINNKKYLVVDNEIIRLKENLDKFLGGDINFITTLVTDISNLFAYRDLSWCQESFKCWDFDNITNYTNAFAFANNAPDFILDIVSQYSTRTVLKFKESIK